jgi:hypothetical protein
MPGDRQEAKYHPSRFDVAIREDGIVIPRRSAAGRDKGQSSIILEYACPWLTCCRKAEKRS